MSGSLCVFIDRLWAAAPRRVPCSAEEKVVHVYTDGASLSRHRGHTHEGRQAHEFLSMRSALLVESEVAASLQRIISPVEAYAVVVARHVWHQYIAQHRVISHIDNNLALDFHPTDVEQQLGS